MPASGGTTFYARSTAPRPLSWNPPSTRWRRSGPTFWLTGTTALSTTRTGPTKGARWERTSTGAALGAPIQSKWREQLLMVRATPKHMCTFHMAEIAFLLPTGAKAAQDWYDELYDPGYDFNAPGFRHGIGEILNLEAFLRVYVTEVMSDCPLTTYAFLLHIL